MRENHMPGELASDTKFEIGHVLFIDIVGYSKLLLNEQRNLVEALNRIVRDTKEFQQADAEGKLVRLPTGDGMALVFYNAPEAPVECALEISRALKERSELQVRIGIHSGPVTSVVDVNERRNIAGAGINTAQRVMACGDAGHILLSKRTAEDLAHSGRWNDCLHELGECEVKHGDKIDIFNFVRDEIGNPALPKKIAANRAKLEAAVKHLRKRRRILAGAAVGVAALTIGLSIFAYRIRERLANAAAIPEQSVAVLPFENLSADPNSAFLSIGIQDEILTRLAKISALKVISRSSTRQYESRPANLPQIAKELGVAAILEGSVQKVGETIRVNVQLVKAATDTHLWAETYDRKLIDVLRVESDVATAVAAQLRATLTPEETARINVTPTNNPDAYEEYLQGREMRIAPASYLPEYDAKQRQHYERAITIDPEFALAHAALSYWYSINGMSGGVTPEDKMKARAEADEALRLQPDLGEAHLALGTYYYIAERNYDAADKEFAIALRALPNDAELIMIRSLMERRRNHWRTAIAGLQHAVSLDPRNVRTITWLGHIYSAVHDYAAAEQTKRREADVASTVSPENAVFSKNGLCYLQWIRTGNIAPMQSLFDQLPQDFDRALRGLILQEIGSVKRDPQMVLEGFEISGDKQDLTQLFFGAVPLLVKGDTSHANEILDGLISQYERRVKENPAEAQFHSLLGLFCAYRGRKEEAIREGRRAVELLPKSKDAAVGPVLESYLAKIYARVGEPQLAIDLIEHLLTVPCEEDATMTKRELQVDWSWDPLRQNPRFQKILSIPEPKVSYN